MQRSDGRRPALVPPWVVPGTSLVLRTGDVERGGAVTRADEGGDGRMLAAALDDTTGLAVGADVQLVLPDPGRGVLVLGGRVVSVHEAEVRLEVQSVGVRREQRRAFARVQAEVAVDLLLPVPVRLTTSDISGGGMQVRLPPGIVLDVGDRPAAVLTLPELGRVPVLARVVRPPEQDGRTRFQFVDLPEAAEGRICRYVLTVQRQRLAARQAER